MPVVTRREGHSTAAHEAWLAIAPVPRDILCPAEWGVQSDRPSAVEAWSLFYDQMAPTIFAGGNVATALGRFLTHVTHDPVQTAEHKAWLYTWAYQLVATPRMWHNVVQMPPLAQQKFVRSIIHGLVRMLQEDGDTWRSQFWHTPGICSQDVSWTRWFIHLCLRWDHCPLAFCTQMTPEVRPRCLKKAMGGTNALFFTV